MQKTMLVLLGISCFAAQAYAGPLEDCIEGLATDASLLPISKEVALAGSKHQTFEMLANTSTPNDQEKPIILEWVKKWSACSADTQSWRESNFHPLVLSIFDNMAGAFLAAAADLYAGKISYGDFAQRRAEIGRTAKQKMTEVDLRLRQQQQDDVARADAARRQAILGILANKPQPYQMQQPYQMPTTKTTTCNTFGAQVVCSTR